MGWNDPDGMRVPFVQDKSPIHGANIIKYWFEQNPELDPLPWPAKGADVNPIENFSVRYSRGLRVFCDLVMTMRFLKR